MTYTNAEMCNMHFVYGLANGNSLRARRMYAERYPNSVTPHHSIFSRLHQRLTESGSFKMQTADNGPPLRVRTAELEEAVINQIEEDPRTSTRKIASTLHVSHQTVWRILKSQLLYPYHIQRVQALLPHDFPQRVAFCQWVQNKIRRNPQFSYKILFTDEATFSKERIINFHNNHVWADENPHDIFQAHHQHQFSVNVWAGIIGDHLIGPYFLPLRLNGDVYRHFLEVVLPVLLEDVPLELRNQIHFMHDGAPAHFSLVARQWLDNVYPNRWIGRGGPQPWPPRSPDLNVLDFFFWGHLKSLVYTTPVENVEELKNRISNSCEIIRNTPGILQRVRESFQRRIDACIAVGGRHFEQLL